MWETTPTRSVARLGLEEQVPRVTEQSHHREFKRQAIAGERELKPAPVAKPDSDRTGIPGRPRRAAKRIAAFAPAPVPLDALFRAKPPMSRGDQPLLRTPPATITKMIS